MLLWLLFWVVAMAHMITSDERVAQGNCTVGLGYGHVKYVEFLILFAWWSDVKIAMSRGFQVCAA